jgi:hypothetical protein
MDMNMLARVDVSSGVADHLSVAPERAACFELVSRDLVPGANGLLELQNVAGELDKRACVQVSLGDHHIVRGVEEKGLLALHQWPHEKVVLPLWVPLASGLTTVDIAMRRR